MIGPSSGSYSAFPPSTALLLWLAHGGWIACCLCHCTGSFHSKWLFSLWLDGTISVFQICSLAPPYISTCRTVASHSRVFALLLQCHTSCLWNKPLLRHVLVTCTFCELTVCDGYLKCSLNLLWHLLHMNKHVNMSVFSALQISCVSCTRCNLETQLKGIRHNGQ